MNKRNLHLIIYSKLERHGGGRETWMSYFVPSISFLFDNIFIYGLTSDPSFYLIFDEKNVFIIRVKATNYFQYILKVFIQILKNYRNNDIVICVGTVVEGVIGILLKIVINRLRLITWIRSIGQLEILARKALIYHFITKIIENRLMKISDLVIANGFDTFNFYKKILPKKKIYIIPNAVRWTYFSNMFLPEFHKPISIGYIGRFNIERGFDYFNSIADYFEDDKDLYFKAWGWGNFTMSKNIVYGGIFNSDNLRDILSQLDIVLFLNRSNMGGGISHSLLEVMASGRLIIAWKNEIFTQILNENNAILIPEGDLSALIEIVKSIKEASKEVLLNKCLKAREDAKKFSVENHIERFRLILNKECLI